MSERSRKENEILLNYFLKLKVFSKLCISTSELLKGLGTITVLHLPPKSCLFRYGQRGEHFYVVLGGLCELYIPND